MRKSLISILLLPCCVLFAGAVGIGAPVIPTKNYYINDYAGVVDAETRDAMLELARELDEKEDIREVVLTIEGFSGYDPDEYAASVYDSWEIGTGGKTGILILLCTGENRIVIKSNTDITATYSLAAAEKLIAEGDFSNAVGMCFFALADSARNSRFGRENARESENAPSASIEPIPQDTHDTQNSEAAVNTQDTGYADKNNESIDRFYIIALGLFLLVALRAVRISMKYRKKYNNNTAYYRTTFPKRYDYSKTARHDDGDYPSGFGGLGNRKAIYGEEMDEAKDIGIIEHDYEDVFDGQEDRTRLGN